MGRNTFNESHLKSLQNLVKEFEGLLVKRSAFYNKAVVIGRPGKNGAIILSLIDSEEDGRSVWLTHLVLDQDPKTLSDGKKEIRGEEFRYYYWADMLKGVKDLCKEI